MEHYKMMFRKKENLVGQNGFLLPELLKVHNVS